jgi:hypothetical protein
VEKVKTTMGQPGGKKMSRRGPVVSVLVWMHPIIPDGVLKTIRGEGVGTAVFTGEEVPVTAVLMVGGVPEA